MAELNTYRSLTITKFSDIQENADNYDVIDVQITGEGDPFKFDGNVYSAIIPFLSTYNPCNHGGRKLLCKILLRSINSFFALQTNNTSLDIENSVELYPYTKEELWAQTLFATFHDKKYLNLDKHSILYDSKHIVHLVVIGFSEWAEAITKIAALVCHYPNYNRNHSLRTRITIVDNDIKQKTAAFVGRFQTLLDNSFVRFVDTKNRSSSLAPPVFFGDREDFVDIEWEFVEGDENSEDIISKLAYWSQDPTQYLTVAFCSDSEERNINAIHSLPSQVNTKNIPILIKIEDDFLFSSINTNPNIITFGKHCPSDSLDRIRKMAIAINYVYNKCYSMNEGVNDKSILSPSEIDNKEAEQLWQNLSVVKRFSSIYHALCIGSKMRSIGIHEDDWDTLYSISAKEIELLSVVEHNRWCVEELILGYRPATDEEIKEIKEDIALKKQYKSQKIHYDLCSYEELDVDETGKRVDIYDICLTAAIPLIVSTCAIKKEVQDA